MNDPHLSPTRVDPSGRLDVGLTTMASNSPHCPHYGVPLWFLQQEKIPYPPGALKQSIMSNPYLDPVPRFNQKSPKRPLPEGLIIEKESPPQKPPKPAPLPLPRQPFIPAPPVAAPLESSPAAAAAAPAPPFRLPGMTRNIHVQTDVNTECAHIQTEPEERTFSLAEVMHQTVQQEVLVRRLMVHLFDTSLQAKRRQLKIEMLEKRLSMMDKERRRLDFELTKTSKELNRMRFEYTCAKEEHLTDVQNTEYRERRILEDLQRAAFVRLQLECGFPPHRDSRHRARDLARWVEKVEEGVSQAVSIGLALEKDMRALVTRWQEAELTQIFEQGEAERQLVQAKVDAKKGAENCAKHYSEVVGIPEYYTIMYENEWRCRENIYLRKDIEALCMAAEHHHQVFQRVRDERDAAKKEQNRVSEAGTVKPDLHKGEDYHLLGTGQYMPEKPVKQFETYWDDDGEQQRPAVEGSYYIHLDVCPFMDQTHCPFYSKEFVKHRIRGDLFTGLYGEDSYGEEFRLRRDMLEHSKQHHEAKVAAERAERERQAIKKRKNEEAAAFRARLEAEAQAKAEARAK
uniref:Uncharacterized protein n=1 Tax=Eutreptiella gymnastica TaxID=73025 RepID=A0A7S1I421_9EUGL